MPSQAPDGRQIRVAFQDRRKLFRGHFRLVLPPVRAVEHISGRELRAGGCAFNDRTQWARRAIINVARMRKFSSDRAVRVYARDIWNLDPYKLPYRIARVLSDENHNSAWPHGISKSLDNLLLVGIRDIVRISLVSIARVQEMPGKIGSSNSCGSQYAFAIR